MKLENRLSKLEQRLKPSINKGWQTFSTHNEETYYRIGVRPNSTYNTLTPKNVDYRKFFSQEGEVFSKGDIDKLTNQGWQVIVIHYVAMAC